VLAAEHALEVQPLLTNIANTAVLFAIGDTISQGTTERKPGQGWNIPALTRAVIYGGIIYCVPCVPATRCVHLEPWAGIYQCETDDRRAVLTLAALVSVWLSAARTFTTNSSTGSCTRCTTNASACHCA
jgi:hypothetical protein